MLLEHIKAAEYVTADQVNKEYTELLESFKSFLNDFSSLDEAMVPVEAEDLEGQMMELSKRFEAAKRALGFVNKLPAGIQRSAHARRVMGNLNTIRAQLSHVIHAVNSQNAEFDKAERGYEYAEQEEMSSEYEEECPVCLQVECNC